MAYFLSLVFQFFAGLLILILGRFAYDLLRHGGRLLWARDLQRHYGTIDGRLARVILGPDSGCRIERRDAARRFIQLYKKQIDDQLTQLELSTKSLTRIQLLADLEAYFAEHGTCHLDEPLRQRLEFQRALQTVRVGLSLKDLRQHLQNVDVDVIHSSVERYYKLSERTNW